MAKWRRQQSGQSACEARCRGDRGRDLNQPFDREGGGERHDVRAIQDAAAEGISDPEQIRERMLKAREEAARG
jgi:hypothetical protein